MQNKEEEIKDLIISYISGSISESDKLILSEKLNSDEHYRRQYNDLVKLYSVSQIPDIESKKSSNYKYLLSQLYQIKILYNAKLEKLNHLARIAAIIVFIISSSISVYYLFTSKSTSYSYLTYKTVVPHGLKSKIILPDGTIAWLNSGSTLEYSNIYGKKIREVTLTGEGYFDVKKDPQKPFIVTANNLKVKVLGTVFNVRSYNNESTVVINLVVGKVNVTLENGKVKSSINVNPNEKVVFSKENHQLVLTKSDAYRATLWTTGKLCFVDATLNEIAKDLERNFDVKIHISSIKAKNELFSGSLDLKMPLKDLLQYIDVDKKYKVEINANTINISDNK